MDNLPRFKQNLHLEGNKVISYVTHVATIDSNHGKLYVHGYWSRTTTKHVNYVASYYGLKRVDLDLISFNNLLIGV